MDILIEQLYKRKKNWKVITIQTLIFVSTITLSMAAYFFVNILSSFLPFGNFFGMLAIIGLVYVGYKFFMTFDLEFE